MWHKAWSNHCSSYDKRAENWKLVKAINHLIHILLCSTTIIDQDLCEDIRIEATSDFKTIGMTWVHAIFLEVESAIALYQI